MSFITLKPTPPPSALKTYLGDGVYVDLEYGRIKLTAEYLGVVDHVIYLEPPVLDALNRWCVRWMTVKPSAGS